MVPQRPRPPASRPPTAAEVRRARSLLADIERRLSRIAHEFYAVGQALRELQRGRGYAALGHRSFRALIEASGLLSPSQAFKLMAIADALSRDQALALGPERAYAVARLAAVTGGAARLFTDGVPVDPEDDDSERVPVTELSLSAIASVLGAARPAGDEAARARRRARVALRRAAVTSATATVARSRGEWWVTVRLPLAELETWAGAPRRRR